jgi:hypothetical protein
MTMVNPAISGYDDKHDASNGVDAGIDNFYSSLQRSRLDYVPPKPSVLQGVITVFILSLKSFDRVLRWPLWGFLEIEYSNMTS